MPIHQHQGEPDQPRDRLQRLLGEIGRQLRGFRLVDLRPRGKSKFIVIEAGGNDAESPAMRSAAAGFKFDVIETKAATTTRFGAIVMATSYDMTSFEDSIRHCVEGKLAFSLVFGYSLTMVGWTETGHKIQSLSKPCPNPVECLSTKTKNTRYVRSNTGSVQSM